MRKLVSLDKKVTFNVTEFFMLINGWEYFVLERDENCPPNCETCLVYGDEIEAGDVYLPEVAPYLTCKSKDLSEVMPPPGYVWAS